MGKRVEKPLLSLICHKGDLWVCYVRTLLRLCIDSSHADRLHEACKLAIFHINGRLIQYEKAKTVYCQVKFMTEHLTLVLFIELKYFFNILYNFNG